MRVGQGRYYIQNDSLPEGGGIKLDSLANKSRGNYDVRVTTRSMGTSKNTGLGSISTEKRMGSRGESEEDLKSGTGRERDSDEVFIVREEGEL